MSCAIISILKLVFSKQFSEALSVMICVIRNELLITSLEGLSRNFYYATTLSKLNDGRIENWSKFVTVASECRNL